MRPLSVTMISNEDDSITLEAGTLRVHIAGEDYQEAQQVAYMLSEALQAQHDLRRVRSLAQNALSRLREIADILDAVEREAVSALDKGWYER